LQAGAEVREEDGHPLNMVPDLRRNEVEVERIGGGSCTVVVPSTVACPNLERCTRSWVVDETRM